MSEIKKMYENADCKKVFHCSECNRPCDDDICKFNIESGFAFFTAEKQIELIKLLKDNRDFYACGNWCTTLDSTGKGVEHRDKNFGQALAGLINQLFIAQDLTEEEKQQVKGILE